MSQGNYIMLTGFVARDPELHVTKEAKTPVVRVRVGSSSRYLNRATGEWVDGDVSYFDVTCWRFLAMNVKASLRKGDKVTLQGKFRTRTWTDSENRPRTSMEIIADAVGHNLTGGWTIYNRGPNNPSKVQEELERGELARGDAAGAEEGFASDYPELGERSSGLAGHARYADGETQEMGGQELDPSGPGQDPADDGEDDREEVSPSAHDEQAPTDDEQAMAERQLTDEHGLIKAPL